MTKPLLVLVLLIQSICLPSLVCGQIKLEISPSSVLGTGNATTFDIILSPTAGETFDALTLAFAVGDGGTVTGNLQDDDNLLITDFQPGSIFDGTDFSPVITTGGVGESAILVDFNRAAGNTANIPANGVLASITLDTSTADRSTVFVLNLNPLSATNVFDDGAPVAFVAEPAQLEFAPTLLGDCNFDRVVNFLDITPFIAKLSLGEFVEEADINQDGTLNFLDISPFVTILSGN